VVEKLFRIPREKMLKISESKKESQQNMMNDTSKIGNQIRGYYKEKGVIV
jgi:diadenosine tetraphosphate (Ap4A) HIT family hydrolase